MESESGVAQACLTLCDPMGCSPPGSFVRGIFQARVLEWVAIAFSIQTTRSLLKKRTRKTCTAFELPGLHAGNAKEQKRRAARWVGEGSPS